jgi:hypothetical protein
LKKFRIYIDETGNSDLKSSTNPNHQYLCLAGAIIDLQYVRDHFQPSLEKLKNDFFNSHPDEPIIFHRKELLYAKHPFAALRNEEIKRNFNQALLELLQKTPFTIIAVLIDKLEHNEGYATWRYDPYHYCQEILVERYRLFLELNSGVGDVMIESRGGKEDMRLKKSFENLLENGTQYLKPQELKATFTSKQLKVKPKSANIAGLQLADLIAHPIRRWIFKNMLNIDDGKQIFSDKIIEVIEPKFMKYKDKIIGYGAKKLP